MSAAAPAPQARALRGLDLLNFFVSDVQTGFGPFIAVYLTEQRWTQIDIGFALSLGTITSMLSQVPAGVLVDAMRKKRAAVGFGIASIIFSALLFAVRPTVLSVYAAEVLHGFASCVLTPAIAAVSLSLVGHAALGERLGRNARFSAIGNGIAAGVMGVAGSYVSAASVFWLTAAVGLPALWALSTIGQAEGEVEMRAPLDWSAVRELVTDRRLLIFGGCVTLFHLSNAAMLPIAAGEVTKSAGYLADVIIAASIVLPQGVTAALSPWAGRRAQSHGRRGVLLIGWAALPARGVLLALLPGAWTLIGLQAISGLSAAVFGVMMPLIAADITRTNGRYNLCMGLLGLMVFVGATISTSFAGWLATDVSVTAAFWGLSAAGLAGTLLVWLAMPETRDA
jgi:MFS family permease